jgi:hypothetical protein
VISSVILCFLSHFVRRRGEGGRGISGRGVGHRRMQPSLSGRRGAEEAGVSAGRRWEKEVGTLTGVGAARGVVGSDPRRWGRQGAEEAGGAHRWWSGTGYGSK